MGLYFVGMLSTWSFENVNSGRTWYKGLHIVYCTHFSFPNYYEISLTWSGSSHKWKSFVTNNIKVILASLLFQKCWSNRFVNPALVPPMSQLHSAGALASNMFYQQTCHSEDSFKRKIKSQTSVNNPCQLIGMCLSFELVSLVFSTLSCCTFPWVPPKRVRLYPTAHRPWCNSAGGAFPHSWLSW